MRLCVRIDYSDQNVGGHFPMGAKNRELLYTWLYPALFLTNSDNSSQYDTAMLIGLHNVTDYNCLKTLIFFNVFIKKRYPNPTPSPNPESVFKACALYCD